jgi:hypothetical protein
LVNEEEKSRILNLHQNRTRSQYLNISEQDDDIYDAWSYESPSGEDETISGEKETEIEKKQEDKKEEDKKEESSQVTIKPEDKKTLKFEFSNVSDSPPFTYMNGSELSYNTYYNRDKDGKYIGDIYRIEIFDLDLTTEEKNVSLYVYGKPQDSVPNPTEIKFNPNDKEFIKFQDLLNQTKTKKDWDKLVQDSLNGVTPTITTNSESNSQTTQTKTEFVPPKTHSEGVSQITEKLKSLGYDTTNIGTAVLQFLEKNKPN